MLIEVVSQQRPPVARFEQPASDVKLPTLRFAEVNSSSYSLATAAETIEFEDLAHRGAFDRDDPSLKSKAPFNSRVEAITRCRGSWDVVLILATVTAIPYGAYVAQYGAKATSSTPIAGILTSGTLVLLVAIAWAAIGYLLALVAYGPLSLISRRVLYSAHTASLGVQWTLLLAGAALCVSEHIELAAGQYDSSGSAQFAPSGRALLAFAWITWIFTTVFFFSAVVSLFNILRFADEAAYEEPEEGPQEDQLELDEEKRARPMRMARAPSQILLSPQREQERRAAEVHRLKLFGHYIEPAAFRPAVLAARASPYLAPARPRPRPVKPAAGKTTIASQALLTAEDDEKPAPRTQRVRMAAPKPRSRPAEPAQETMMLAQAIGGKVLVAAPVRPPSPTRVTTRPADQQSVSSKRSGARRPRNHGDSIYKAPSAAGSQVWLAQR